MTRPKSVEMYRDKYSNQQTNSKVRKTNDGYEVIISSPSSGMISFELGKMKFSDVGENITTDEEEKDLQDMIELACK